jgi:hypothetical protein
MICSGSIWIVPVSAMEMIWPTTNSPVASTTSGIVIMR